MIWRIDFSREASQYAIDSHPYNEDVLIAIETLAFTQDGLPQEDIAELETDVYLWQVAGHSVIYQRIASIRRLWVAVIKPDE